MMNTSDNIAAPATGIGGAISILRISGPDALAIGNRVWHGKTPLSPANARTMLLGHAGSDSALAVYMKAPASYTGDDVVELHCHGGAATADALLRLLLSSGCRMAEPGEFTFRAFVNGKMDLVQAEAVADVIGAGSEQALNVAERQLAGSLSRRLDALWGTLNELRAECESHLDFPEEELAWDPDVAAKINAVAAELGSLLETRELGATLRDGVSLVLAGDLQAQCTASSYAMRELGVPFAGLFGACSTMAESLTLAALLVESGAAEKALAVTSSHFCSSERQFRFPLNYGGVRTPTAQHTATASGAALVGKQGSIHIEEVCIGRVVDLGVTDLNNMGAAMAPAAWDTLRQYFADTGTGPADYDKIITGDLAQVGSDLLVRLAAEEGCDLRPRYTDCGLMLYDREGQKVDAGASGCGCSAAVMCAHFLPAMQRGEYKNILFMATGALMSPTACQQGESIPGVAHLLHLTAAGEPLS